MHVRRYYHLAVGLWLVVPGSVRDHHIVVLVIYELPYARRRPASEVTGAAVCTLMSTFQGRAILTWLRLGGSRLFVGRCFTLSFKSILGRPVPSFA